jgi:hypothetical protein
LALSWYGNEKAPKGMITSEALKKRFLQNPLHRNPQFRVRYV